LGDDPERFWEVLVASLEKLFGYDPGRVCLGARVRCGHEWPATTERLSQFRTTLDRGASLGLWTAVFFT